MSTSESPPDGREASVLVVDDDAAIRETVTAVLEVEGISVSVAWDGAEALRRLRAGERPSVILLDLRMPGMDGREFRERQNQEGEIASIPVVILSGDRDARQIAASLGVECLHKPVDLETLLSTVRRYERPAD